MATLVAHAQTTHELVATDFEFTPSVINAVQGDSVHVVFTDTDHTFTQVSEATWNANGSTSNGGYDFGPGLTEVTFVLGNNGTVHYVCAPHAGMGMKGIIDVAVGVEEQPLIVRDVFYPNPATQQVWLRNAPANAAFAVFFDANGHEVHRTSLRGDRPLPIDHLLAGLYTVRVSELGGNHLFLQRLLIE